jgi:uncharacterized protein DUF1559
MVGEEALEHPGKESLVMKRRMAGWSIDFLMQVLTGSTVQCAIAPSHHKGGAFFCFADGQVRFLSENIDLTTYRAPGARVGNEIVDHEDF